VSGYRLDVRGLNHAADGVRILHDIDLCFEGGEFVAVLGPSGSGKSTLLTSMIGFRHATGRVLLSAHDLVREFEHLKTRIGFVPQDDVVPTALSVEAALDYAAQLRLPPAMPEASRRALVRSVLRQVELEERAGVRIRRLSGGQRKRVSIAIELLSKPPLMVLDEPTSGLDPDLEDKMMALLRSITDHGRITIVTTHVLASLDRVDLAVVLAKGRVVYIGPPSEAPRFFDVEDLGAVYKKLASGPAEPWAAKLRASPLHKKYVLDRLAAPPPDLPGTTGAADQEPADLEPLPAAPPAAPTTPPTLSPEEELRRLKAQLKKS
jgi:ABC-type multidrug transport system ATPase subunit